MTGIPARSPAKGLGAFDRGLDPGEECAKGGVRAPRAKPLERGGTRKANRAPLWLRQRNAKEKALPVQEIKLFSRVPPAPPKEGPLDRGICGLAWPKFRDASGVPSATVAPRPKKRSYG